MAVFLGINLWNWTNGLGPDCAGLPAKIAALGFTGIELPMTDPMLSPAFLREVRDSRLEVSLCAAMSEGRDLSNFDSGVRVRTMEYLTRCLETAEQTGARVLAGPLYAGGGKRHRLPPGDAAREWELAVEGLRALSERAENSGVLLALEPLNRYRTSVVNTARQVLRMISDIGRPNVGVHFDTYQAGIEEDDLTGALESVLQAGKLFHVHACANNRGAPGQGFFPWDTIFGLLHRYGYAGHITMETFAPGGLDSGWLDPELTPDELAQTGLDCLRAAFPAG